MTGDGDHELYRIGDLTLDVGARLLTRSGALVALPPKTFELFLELVRRAPGVVRRQELLDTVWAHELVNDEALTQRVMLLRRALDDDPREPRFIASAPRWGYRMVAPVERVAAPPRPQPTTDAAGADDSAAARLRVTLTSVRRRDRIVVLAAGIVAAVLAATAAIVAVRGTRHGIDSLAIAPFASGDAATRGDELCDGIPMTVTRALSRIPGLRVIAASTMSRFRGGTTDPQAIGREVRVRAVLTGTLLRKGNELQVAAELVDVTDGELLWSERYLRPAADVFALQDEISEEIVRGLRLKLPAADLTRVTSGGTSSVQAYELYLRGRRAWNERAEGAFENAAASFRKAIQIDPAYALAYSGLADTYALQSATEYGVIAPADAMPAARAAAEKALAADPGLAEGHASLGLVLWLYAFDRRTAETHFRRATELDPGYAPAHQWLAEMLAEQGRADEAWSQIERARELDPLSLVVAADLGLLQYYRRDYKAAIRQYRAALALDPGFGQAALGLGLATARTGRLEESLGIMEAVNRSAQGSPPALAALGYAQALAGKREDALTTLEQLRALSARRFVSGYYLAGIYLGLGDRDRAFEWLERACAERCSMVGTLEVDAAFDPIREDPRFAALLRCANLDS